MPDKVCRSISIKHKHMSAYLSILLCSAVFVQVSCMLIYPQSTSDTSLLIPVYYFARWNVLNDRNRTGIHSTVKEAYLWIG